VGNKIKKDFDKEQMYSKIMPSIVTHPPGSRQEYLPDGCSPEDASAGGEQRYVLRNFIEDIVMDKLSHTMNMLRCCECELCTKDVMAKALNALPTAYVAVMAEEMEETVAGLRQTWEVKVSSALIRAVQEVKAGPRHNPGR
jgi:hypothetical protein